jgi:hypothetical protein
VRGRVGEGVLAAEFLPRGISRSLSHPHFPTVSRELAVAALEQAKAHLTADARAA